MDHPREHRTGPVLQSGHPPIRADIPVSNGGDLILIHVILHKWVWVGEIVPFSPLQK